MITLLILLLLLLLFLLWDTATTTTTTIIVVVVVLAYAIVLKMLLHIKPMKLAIGFNIHYSYHLFTFNFFVRLLQLVWLSWNSLRFICSWEQCWLLLMLPQEWLVQLRSGIIIGRERKGLKLSRVSSCSSILKLLYNESHYLIQLTPITYVYIPVFSFVF